MDPKTYRAWYQAMLEREGEPFWPDAAWRDIVFGVCMVTAIVLAALVFGAPALDKPPDPTVLSADPRPDWYLLWYFGALALIPPALENAFMILSPLVAGARAVPDPLRLEPGRAEPGQAAVGGRQRARRLHDDRDPVGRRGRSRRGLRISTRRRCRPRWSAASAGPVVSGARLFHDKGCEACHTIAGLGGQRGPDLTDVGDRLTPAEMTSQILNGGTNMPAFADNITPGQLDELIAFLKTRVRH